MDAEPFLSFNDLHDRQDSLYRTADFINIIYNGRCRQ